jgi:hypothetical protein
VRGQAQLVAQQRADEGRERRAEHGQHEAREPPRARERAGVHPRPPAAAGLGVADHVHVDRAGPLHDGGADARVEQAREPGPARGADDELGGVDAAGEVEQRGRHVVADDRVERGAEVLGEPADLGDRVRADAGEAVAAQDVQHEQLRPGPGGDPAGPAHECLGFGPAGHRDDHALACLPGLGDVLLGAVAPQRDVDLVGHPQQGELPQRGEVAGPEVVAEGGVDDPGRVDVAVREPAAQRLRGDVDQLELLGTADDLVGHRLLLAHPGDLLDDVVDALQVLDVDRGEHGDPGGQQPLDVLPALLVARAGDVGVRELVDERDLWRAGEDRVHVELGELAAAVDDRTPRHDLEADQQRVGPGPLVRLDQADDDVGAALDAPVRLAEHRERLADAGCGAEVDA